MALTLEDVDKAVREGNTAAVTAGLAQGGGAALAIGDVKEDWFIAACRRGYTEVVQLLLGLSGARAIDVHVDDEAGFR
jgi:hypothetical protein